MLEVHKTITIDAAPERVWAIAGDPAIIARWLPVLASSRPDGDRRSCITVDGAELRERIVERNETERLLRLRDHRVLDAAALPSLGPRRSRARRSVSRRLERPGSSRSTPRPPSSSIGRSRRSTATAWRAFAHLSRAARRTNERAGRRRPLSRGPRRAASLGVASARAARSPHARICTGPQKATWLRILRIHGNGWRYVQAAPRSSLPSTLTL